MPTQPCKLKSGKGYRYGVHGKCYTGKGGLAKALRQGRAIEASKTRGKKLA